jgi:hypothetical protein
MPSLTESSICLPCRRFESIPSQDHFSHPRLLETLFADGYLLFTLAQKREWSFCQPPDVLLIVLTRIPTIPQSVQKVYFSLDDCNDRALKRLSIITELVVNVEYQDPPLYPDNIAKHFPCLQHLKIYVPSKVYGSLNDLERLVSLEITSTTGGTDRAFSEKFSPI